MLIIQWNEANFDIIKNYKDDSKLQNLFTTIEDLNEIKTYSEPLYENLEPWIQWVSFYTGEPFSSHNVFHLGDYKNVKESDLFNQMTKQGKKVGLFGSMNHPGGAQFHRYIPDAWSDKNSDYSTSSRCAQKVIATLVNNNSEFKSPVRIIPHLLVMFFSTSGFKKYNVIMRAIISLINRDRAKLSSLFDFFFLMFAVTQHKRQKLDISSIFLNAFAHVQHHYMLSSKFVDGSNPDWYISKDEDPILSSLRIYDEIFAWLAKSKIEKSIITGLSQQPFRTPEIYWRFKNHEAILNKLIPFKVKCQPRMTRDMHLILEDEAEAKTVLDILSQATVKNNRGMKNAFGHIDRNKNTVFCSFLYNGENDDAILSAGKVSINLKNEISFVAIKNAGHIQQGWCYVPKSTSDKIKNTSVKIWELGKYFA